MPVRLLRSGIRTSEAWNATSFRAQSLYIGILTLVDDYGRYDGRSQLLHAEIFGLRDNVTRQNTAADLRELGEQGLVQLYTVGGKEYLQVTRWQERKRSVPRYPDPPAVNCQQMTANDSNCRPPTPSPSPSPAPATERSQLPATTRSTSTAPSPDRLPIAASLSTPEFLTVWKEWESHRKEIKHPLTRTQTAEQLKQLAEWGPERSIAAIRHTIYKGWRGIREQEETQSSNGSSPKQTFTPFAIKQKISAIIAARNRIYDHWRGKEKEMSIEDRRQMNELQKKRDQLEAQLTQ